MVLPPLCKCNNWNDVTFHQKIKQYKDGIAPTDKFIQNFVKLSQLVQHRKCKQAHECTEATWSTHRPASFCLSKEKLLKSN